MATRQEARQEQFRSFYADAYPDVLRFVERRVHAGHAEDVVAEAFLAAWRRFEDAPQSRSDQRAWIFGITRNCLLNARRGLNRGDALAVRIGEALMAHPPTPASDPDLLALRADLARAWRSLAPDAQEVLALAVFEDLTSPQAGLVLGISSAAYRLRLMRARGSLRRLLDAREPEVPHPNDLQEARP